MRPPDVKWPLTLPPQGVQAMSGLWKTKENVNCEKVAQGHHQHNSQLPAPRSQALKSKGWHPGVTQREEEMISVGHGMVLRQT